MQTLGLNNVGRKFRKLGGLPDSLDYKGPNARLTRHSDDFWALKNIHMDIEDGEIVGIIGRNGAGKTTLLNIIAGILPPSEGEVTVNGKVSALLTLGAGFQEEFTGKENIYLHASLLGLKKQEIESRYMSILEFSELGDFINAPLGSYSNGMKMRLGFSIAIHNNFDILVTDEIMMVGDIYFQKKSFERMKEFKKQGKTMLIVTHDMGMVKGFCDRVYLLEDGKIAFNGATRDGIEQYEKLLNKKKVLSEASRLDMICETKRWATDVTEWGKKEGTKEVVIKKVTLLDGWGRKIARANPGEKIIVKVDFASEEAVDNFHFGIAIFREDGVYCYGPNTKFDGLSISGMNKGQGYFEFECKKLLLMPGNYYLSVAIWDKNETLPYDYHRCCYKIQVAGDPVYGQLLALPAVWAKSASKQAIGNNKKIPDYYPNLDYLMDRWGTESKSDCAAFDSVKCFDNYGGQDGAFVSGRDLKLKINFEISVSLTRELILWAGIYRSDNVYCYGSTRQISLCKENYEILNFPGIMLLPGGYRVSVGIWDTQDKIFLAYSHGIHPFNMISQKKDHGTIYLEHRWSWKLP